MSFKLFFSKEGRYPGYRHTQSSARNTSRYTPSKRRDSSRYNPVVKGERSGYRQDPSISVLHRKERDLVQAAHRYISLTAKGIEIRRAGKTQSAGQAENPTRRAGKTRRAETLTHEDTQIIQCAARLNHTTGGKTQSAGQAETPIPAGRDPHPRGRQPGHQGERASVKETSRTQRLQPVHSRMQGDRKDQHSSHSLNQWKERFDLWHRHAGMLTRGEPYKLIGILNKEPRSLMTWFGPSPERGPGTQPTKIVSEVFSSIMLRQCIQPSYSSYMLHPILQCIQSKGGQIYRQGNGPMLHPISYNVFNRKEDSLLMTGQWP